MAKTKEFRNYRKSIQLAIKNIRKELAKSDTNFNRILAIINNMEGRTRNFV